MKRIEVDALSEATNSAVLRMPNRRFPGILIQGDSLNALNATADAVAKALIESRADDARDELAELCALLKSYKATYEAALEAEGMQRPY